MLTRNAATDFWAKVNKTETCWLWTGRTDPNGYATLMVAGVRIGVHRYAYQLMVGPIPAGHQLDHICHDPDHCSAKGRDCAHRRCVNPAHLRPATPRENTLRSRSIQSLNAAKTHCGSGHEFTLENTYRWHGDRYCRECARQHTRAWIARKVKASA